MVYLVYYRSSYGSLDKQLVFAEDADDVQRIFDGLDIIEIVPVVANDPEPQPEILAS